MSKARLALLVAPLVMAAGMTGAAQDRGNFYNGMHDGAHGGYYDHGHDHPPPPPPRQGGIGPGKGALIGAGGGAVLGALFGGAKGALVGGAAGAGIGAVAGQEHQNNVRRDNYYGR